MKKLFGVLACAVYLTGCGGSGGGAGAPEAAIAPVVPELTTLANYLAVAENDSTGGRVVSCAFDPATGLIGEERGSVKTTTLTDVTRTTSMVSNPVSHAFYMIASGASELFEQFQGTEKGAITAGDAEEIVQSNTALTTSLVVNKAGNLILGKSRDDDDLSLVELDASGKFSTLSAVADPRLVGIAGLRLPTPWTRMGTPLICPHSRARLTCMHSPCIPMANAFFPAHPTTTAGPAIPTCLPDTR